MQLPAVNGVEARALSPNYGEWEATLQTVPQPDKSIRYRIRLGPYDNAEELNRVKAELGTRGFDVAVIKNP